MKNLSYYEWLIEAGKIEQLLVDIGALEDKVERKENSILEWEKEIDELDEENQFLLDVYDKLLISHFQILNVFGDYSLYFYDTTGGDYSFDNTCGSFKNTLDEAREWSASDGWKIQWHFYNEGSVFIDLAQKDEDIQFCLEAMREQNKDKSIPQIIWKSYNPENED